MGSLLCDFFLENEACWHLCFTEGNQTGSSWKRGSVYTRVCIHLYVACLTTSEPLCFKFGFTCFHLLCIPRKYWELTLHFHLSLPLWEADLFSSPWISEQTSEKQRRDWDYHPQIPGSLLLTALSCCPLHSDSRQADEAFFDLFLFPPPVSL